MVLNIIEPAQTRYILAAEDLENFLKEKFGEGNPDYDFKVEVCDKIKKDKPGSWLTVAQHVCDRWTFEAPEKVDPLYRNLIDEIEARG
ncbi:hypothetical protein GGP41_008353 [Bipolaris sorokiniana]|uniref:Uncharacterized protein n=1 Tax=Cochliobolus sativus TaxID=45130 RepID=A0A8H6DS74_COCSA|nr:hypothetical protein GGP41_008353 [Bipolaris sorokiniana]